MVIVYLAADGTEDILQVSTKDAMFVRRTVATAVSPIVFIEEIGSLIG